MILRRTFSGNDVLMNPLYARLRPVMASSITAVFARFRSDPFAEAVGVRRIFADALTSLFEQ